MGNGSLVPGWKEAQLRGKRGGLVPPCGKAARAARTQPSLSEGSSVPTTNHYTLVSEPVRRKPAL